MKEIWPDTRVGCLQYRVKVEKKNEELWKYLKKDIFKKTRDAIFDNGINEIPNVKESRAAYKAFGKDPSRYRVSSEALIRRIGQKGETYKGIGKDEIKIEALPVLADKDGAIGSSTSDSERAMITEDVTEVLTLIYSFSGNDDLEKALEYGRKYLEEYAGAQNLESWIVE